MMYFKMFKYAQEIPTARFFYRERALLFYITQNYFHMFKFDSCVWTVKKLLMHFTKYYIQIQDTN